MLLSSLFTDLNHLRLAFSPPLEVACEVEAEAEDDDNAAIVIVVVGDTAEDMLLLLLLAVVTSGTTAFAITKLNVNRSLG